MYIRIKAVLVSGNKRKSGVYEKVVGNQATRRGRDDSQNESKEVFSSLRTMSGLLGE
jgi:hypothetical protein